MSLFCVLFQSAPDIVWVSQAMFLVLYSRRFTVSPKYASETRLMVLFHGGLLRPYADPDRPCPWKHRSVHRNPAGAGRSRLLGPVSGRAGRGRCGRTYDPSDSLHEQPRDLPGGKDGTLLRDPTRPPSVDCPVTRPVFTPCFIVSGTPVSLCPLCPEFSPNTVLVGSGDFSPLDFCLQGVHPTPCGLLRRGGVPLHSEVL